MLTLILARLANNDPSLQFLDLSWTSISIGPEGARAIAAALASNTCLQSLDLQDNPISPEVKLALTRMPAERELRSKETRLAFLSGRYARDSILYCMDIFVMKRMLSFANIPPLEIKT
jgi:hypothetical protein